MVPRTFVVKPNETLLIAGIARIDFLELTADERGPTFVYFILWIEPKHFSRIPCFEILENRKKKERNKQKREEKWKDGWKNALVNDALSVDCK